MASPLPPPVLRGTPWAWIWPGLLGEGRERGGDRIWGTGLKEEDENCVILGEWSDLRKGPMKKMDHN
jgi:hypothetical protein